MLYRTECAWFLLCITTPNPVSIRYSRLHKCDLKHTHKCVKHKCDLVNYVTYSNGGKFCNITVIILYAKYQCSSMSKLFFCNLWLVNCVALVVFLPPHPLAHAIQKILQLQSFRIAPNPRDWKYPEWEKTKDFCKPILLFFPLNTKIIQILGNATTPH